MGRKQKAGVISLKGSWSSGRVWLNGRELLPGASLRVVNHSPSGFSWGYGGSGPAELALAILLCFYPAKEALAFYQEFKWAYIAKLPQRDFEVSIDLAACGSL